MRHPTDATLRRLLDEPAGVADADREHVAGCAVCRSGLATAQRDAEFVAAALDVETDVDVDAAWRRLSRAVAADEPRRRVSAPGVRWRGLLRSPVVAAVGVVALLTGAGAAAATDWLQIFRTEQVAPVTVTRAQAVALPELDAYGDLVVTARPDLRIAADAAAAAEATGLRVPRVAELPPGVSGDPVYQVGDQASALFTFSVEKATLAAAAAGEPLPPPPPGLEHSQFRITAGPGLAAIWGPSRAVPDLMVVRAVPPTVYSSAVPFETARDYILTLPGVPDDVAAQLRALSTDGTTLPLHVLTEEMVPSAADVNGAPATVLTSRGGTMAAVVWVEDGVVTAVAGSLSADEVLSVARGLS